MRRADPTPTHIARAARRPSARAARPPSARAARRSRRMRRAAVLAAATLGAGLFAGAAVAGDEVDLVGTWHVLVHYTDADSANPDAVHWDDRIWVFAREGSRLVWTEYPIVVFRDGEGRFELGPHGQQRVLHAWEPNDAQRAQIREGLEFNSRGAKSKSLRRSRKDGRWQSAEPLPTQSANTIGYHETWIIRDPTGLPVFVRDDVLGSERAEAMNGRTLYTTESASPSGATLRGSFARDESRRGTFRMTRSGEARSVGTKRTQAERLRDFFGAGADDGDAGAGEDASADADDRGPGEDADGGEADAGERDDAR